MKKRSAQDYSLDPRANNTKKYAPERYAIRDGWISASSVKNYMLDDPLLDFLEQKSNNYRQSLWSNSQPLQSDIQSLQSNNQLVPSPVSTVPPEDSDNLCDFLILQGTLFESCVISMIREFLQPHEFIKITNSANEINFNSYNKTVEQINKRTPVICQGVVHNANTKTYGSPDLIIRADYAQMIFNDTTCTNLENFGTNYVIIDIKFTILPMRCNSNQLRDTGRFRAYKSQILIYNEALSIMQNYKANEMYICGRGWKMGTETCNNALDRLGVVKCDEKMHFNGKDLYSNTMDAVKWRRKCVMGNVEFDIENLHPNLYPNMCNPYDIKYRQEKEKIAENIGEITQLWQCGMRHRRRLHKANITSWRHPNCTAERMNHKGERAKIIQKMIDFHKKVNTKAISPDFINSNDTWARPSETEIFLDFEFTNSIIDDFTDMPYAKNDTYVYLIGVYVCRQWSKDNSFKYFLCNSLSQNEEKRIFDEFREFMRNLKNPIIYHWGHIESHILNKYMPNDSYNLIDLCRVFSQIPIMITGVHSYSLKKIGKRLFELGEIGGTWDGKLDGGGNSMLQAKKHYENNLSFNDIVYYNEIDCKMVKWLLDFIRRRTYRYKLRSSSRVIKGN